jgi:hypothetical protein
MDEVRWWYDLTLGGYAYNFTFIRIEVHLPVTLGIDSSTQIDAILLDFSKAFDKVSHERLAAKLHHYGVRGPTLNWIKSFLAGHTQRVIVEGL